MAKAPAAAAAFTITDHDYNPVNLPGPHNCMWNQKPYTAADISVEFGQDDRVPPTLLVWVQWTDPDGIIHRKEAPLPGGGMGPFYVQA